MKAQKNKIVFVLVMVCVVLFLTIYGIMTFGKDKEPELEPDRIPMPDLEENEKVYETKLEALDNIKEEHETTAPQVYPDHMVDDKGYFNPDYLEYEKHRIIDSVYQSGNLDPKRVSTTLKKADSLDLEPQGEKTEHDEQKNETPMTTKALGLEHQLFFASNPKSQTVMEDDKPKFQILAYVDGNQVVRDGHRLAVRIEEAIKFNGMSLEKGTLVHGFVKIRPNRVMVEFPEVGHNPIKFKAYDFQDGNVGIYVENHLKGEVLAKSMDETLAEINIPGVPQFNGIKRIFQRHNRAIKVEIKDKYQFILKP
ncbi:MAG: conjugative transposon protein TraM [Allomuricauda sp.]